MYICPRINQTHTNNLIHKNMNTILNECTITDYNDVRCVSITFQERVNGPETHVEIFCKEKKILKESFITFVNLPTFDLLNFYLNNYNSKYTL